MKRIVTTLAFLLSLFPTFSHSTTYHPPKSSSSAPFIITGLVVVVLLGSLWVYKSKSKIQPIDKEKELSYEVIN